VETSITNYEINKTVEHIINSVGNIKRLSVATLLDGVYKKAPAAEGGAVQEVYEPRAQEDIDQISAIIKNAVGYDSERGDKIEVVNLPFDRTGMEFEQEKLDKIVKQEFYFDIGKKIGLVILAVLAFLFIRRTVKKLFASLVNVLPTAQPTKVGSKSTASAPGQAIIEEEEIPPILPESRKPKLVDQMQVAAKGRPEEIAKVIRTMMVE